MPTFCGIPLVNMLLYPRHLFTDPEFLQKGWPAWFQNEHPLNLEIGCGYGHFLSYMARRFPEQNFIGLDIVNKILRQLGRALERDGLNNARVCKLDANLALRELFPDGSLANLYILFPDPWFKERRLKRRIMRAETLPEMLRVLAPGGHLHFVSDDTDYAQDARALLDACPQLQAVPFPEIEVRTKYERKWLQQEKQITRLSYQLEVSQKKSEVWPAYAVTPVIPLQNWGAEQAEAFWKGFQPLKEISEGWIIRVTACYYAAVEGRLLLRCLLAEEGALALHFWLEVSAQGHLELARGSCLPRLRHRQILLEKMARLIERVLN